MCAAKQYEKQKKTKKQKYFAYCKKKIAEGNVRRRLIGKPLPKYIMVVY